MALTQTGAAYPNRAYIMGKDRFFAEALDALASADKNIGNQTNASPQASQPAPSTPTSISVSAANGFGTVSITHNNSPRGTAYLIEYSSTPTFTPETTVQIDNGISKSFLQYLKGQTLFFRVASTFYTSEPSSYVYYGGQASPKAVTF
jgi:hypothetical protein